MRTTTISHLKAKLSEHIAWVKRGEEVLITERGKPVARMVAVTPGPADDDRMRALAARGVVRSGKKQVRKGLPALPIYRVPEGAVLRALDDERQDRA
jgi:prevent-host-death family protein